MNRIVQGSTLPIQQIKVVGYDGDLQDSVVSGTIRPDQEPDPRVIKGSLTMHSGNIVHWVPDDDDLKDVGINHIQLTFFKGGKYLHTMITKLEILPLQVVPDA